MNFIFRHITQLLFTLNAFCCHLVFLTFNFLRFYGKMETVFSNNA